MGNWGVGMPQALMLEEFGHHIWSVFGQPPYLVGSALFTTKWRDVDVRMMLNDEEWKKWFPDLAVNSSENDWQKDSKWVAITLAFSELGKKLTGLPIDFQVQPATYANAKHDNPRSSLGHVPYRYESWKRKYD